MGYAIRAPRSNEPYDNTPIFERIAEDLYARGYSLIDEAIPEQLAEALFTRVLTLNDTDFSPAGIGRADALMQNDFVRRDEIRWMSTEHEAEHGWLDWVEQLRIYLNRRLFMGLFSYEAHFAHYAPGAFYKRHVDAFRGGENRILTTVLYLNSDWVADDGGEMLLYLEDNGMNVAAPPIARVMPTLGRLAVFLSEEFPHEVLPAKRDRYSIAGWYRINTSTAEKVDPPD